MTKRRPFEEIVTEHGPKILRVCRAILGYHEGEDAWSETFLAALRAYPDLDAGANIEAWLVTIAKRKAIDHYRRGKRESVPIESVPEIASHDGEATVADDDLWSALESLTLKQREVIAYHHLAGLPYAEIATILGTNEAAARRAGADGIKKLRAIYGEAHQ
jgi:RNA polymerase sigma factor (sigma-70 family)